MEVLKYTLAEVYVYCDALRKRKNNESAARLVHTRLAYHGSKEDVDGALREL